MLVASCYNVRERVVIECAAMNLYDVGELIVPLN